MLRIEAIWIVYRCVLVVRCNILQLYADTMAVELLDRFEQSAPNKITMIKLIKNGSNVFQ